MRKRLVVVVTGGRNYRDIMTVYRELQKVKPARVVTGQCHRGGADGLAQQWAEMKGVEYQGYPADWKTFGWQAGPIRNSEMLKAEKPDVVIAFPGGAGTADCVRKAKALGIPVVEVAEGRDIQAEPQPRRKGILKTVREMDDGSVVVKVEGK